MSVDSKTPVEVQHQKLVDVCLDLYSGIISKTKGMLEESFNQQPQKTLHDGEKRLVLDISRDVFKATVTHSMLKQIVDSLPSPQVEEVGLNKETVSNHEPADAGRATMTGTKVAGI